MMSEEEQNKALVSHFLQELAKGNVEVTGELLSPDFVDRSLLPGQGTTREDFRRSVEEILDAFRITSFIIEEQIAEGDKVVSRFRWEGAHQGEFLGIPAIGRQIAVKEW